MDKKENWFMSFLKTAFKPDLMHVPTKEDAARTKDNIVKSLVSRYSRGNISLQQSRYMTREDIELRRNSILDPKS